MRNIYIIVTIRGEPTVQPTNCSQVKNPLMTKLQQFGKPCIVYNEGSKQTLDARVKQAIFLGINTQSKG